MAGGQGHGDRRGVGGPALAYHDHDGRGRRVVLVVGLAVAAGQLCCGGAGAVGVVVGLGGVVRPRGRTPPAGVVAALGGLCPSDAPLAAFVQPHGP
ncbi:hypothetical protein Ae505Ps2_6256c [Pseudonocardia sp. Ae505_Ps2]|nr:hypothetical protein Ae505Ps2_6256c [Pseudonocardia sp. Ae505_Ps2]